MVVTVFRVDAVARPILGLAANTVSPVLASSTVNDTDAYRHWLSACKRLKAACKCSCKGCAKVLPVIKSRLTNQVCLIFICRISLGYKIDWYANEYNY